MTNRLISHCDKSLNFSPAPKWPTALPAICWRGYLLAGFDRQDGHAIDTYDLEKAGLVETIKACYPDLGLAELARLTGALSNSMPDTYIELRQGLFKEYGLRWGERLEEILILLPRTSIRFQNWIDDKKISSRDLAPLLALNEKFAEFQPFLETTTELRFSRHDGVRALELGVELFLMGHPLNDLLPATGDAAKYLHQLELWRRPQALQNDDELKKDIAKWPWPAHVQAQWQRFGDQSGLEVKIRTTSAQDFNKKLEHLLTIGNTWSAKN